MADAEGNRYGPYDIEVLGSEAEAFTEDAWYQMHRESGVMSGGALTFTGLTAHLAPVELRSHGSFLAREDEWTDDSPATTGAAPRRDLLVARRQLTAGEGESAVPGKTFLTVLRGTPAATPGEPADFDPDTDEPLWSWQVPGGGGTVVSDVRDRRRFITRGGELRSRAETVLWANTTLAGANGITTPVVTADLEGAPYRLRASASVETMLVGSGVPALQLFIEGILRDRFKMRGVSGASDLFPAKVMGTVDITDGRPVDVFARVDIPAGATATTYTDETHSWLTVEVIPL